VTLASDYRSQVEERGHPYLKVSVSVTTTKARLEVFFYALQSLKKQDYDDYSIVVNLSDEPYLFDKGVDAVPDWMTDGRVHVRFVNNSGPYRKLLPVIEEVGEEDIVVTADDDVLYSKHWLRRMIERATSHPGHVVCARARRIQKNIIGRFQNYSNWPLIVEKTEGLLLLPIGCSGVAYRKSLLDMGFILDTAYLDCAPTADDIWFRLASIRKNVKVYVDPEIDVGNSFIQHFMGLQHMNTHTPQPGNGSLLQRETTRVIARLKDYLGIPISGNDLAWKKSLDLIKSRGQLTAF
jgi:hypothetical protein